MIIMSKGYKKKNIYKIMYIVSKRLQYNTLYYIIYKKFLGNNKPRTNIILQFLYLHTV